jgi:hypothetical protein
MRSIKRLAVALCLGALAALSLEAGATQPGCLGAVEAIKIATQAYIYGYPLVTFDMARRQQTNVAVSDADHAPMGQCVGRMPEGRSAISPPTQMAEPPSAFRPTQFRLMRYAVGAQRSAKLIVTASKGATDTPSEPAKCPISRQVPASRA